MDLHTILRELYRERDRLDNVIRSLEVLRDEEAAETPPKRRGRKSMSPEERLEVSRRMLKYWEKRRRQQ